MRSRMGDDGRDGRKVAPVSRLSRCGGRAPRCYWCGCVTSGEVRKARENHLSCLDRQLVEVQAAQSMFGSAEQTKAAAADCWRVFQRQIAAGQDGEVTAVECRQLDAYAEMFDDRVSYYGGRATEVEASCRALGANAQELAARRDGQQCCRTSGTGTSRVRQRQRRLGHALTGHEKAGGPPL